MLPTLSFQSLLLRCDLYKWVGTRLDLPYRPPCP
jgi:hypothetical protein